ASNWHPLTWLSHLLDVQLFGLAPGRHHLASVLLHTANTLLLAHLLTRLTSRPVASALAALLFAIHPLHVESVAYVAERKDVLSSFWGLLAMLAYVRYTEYPSWQRQLPVVLCFLLSLLAKPMLVTLPFLLLLLDWWPLQRLRPGGRASLGRLLGEKLPLFALTAASCVITYQAKAGGGSVASLATSSLAANLANALVTYGRYLVMTIWPIGLAAFYPFPAQLPTWQVTVTGLLLTTVTVTVILAGRRRPYLAVGWFWYLGTLVPVIGIVRVGEQAMADRYTYLPLVGIFIMVVWLAADLVARRPAGRSLAVALTLLTVTPLLVLCQRQIGTWRDSFTLFSHAATVTSGNWLAHHNLGVALMDRRRYDDALAQFDLALALKPDYKNAYFNRGNVYFNLANRDLTIAAYQEAIRLDPNYVSARRNLIKAYLRWGELAQARQEYELLRGQAPDEAALLASHFPEERR
ncbi:MAG TPA: tetratricopeptide repeat protein, partial [Geobacteraceae bacterium]